MEPNQFGGCLVFLSLLLLVGGLFGVGVRALYQAELDRVEGSLRPLARRLGGEVRRGTVRSPWVVAFTVHGRAAEMRFVGGPDHEPAAAAVAVDLRGVSPGALKIFPETFGASILKFFGGQDLAVGDREFDGLYVVRAWPPSLLPAVFSLERRPRLVAAIRRLGRRGGVVVDLNRESLRIRVDPPLAAHGEVLELKQTAAELTRFILDVGISAGIHWVEPAQGAPGSVGAQCQVCGTEMRERIVHCARCRTPHHEECWTYAGECSTFACKEKRYVVGGRTVLPPPRPVPRQTPDEWLREEIARDRRESR